MTIGPGRHDLVELGRWGADIVIGLSGSDVEEDIAAGIINTRRGSGTSGVLNPVAAVALRGVHRVVCGCDEFFDQGC